MKVEALIDARAASKTKEEQYIVILIKCSTSLKKIKLHDMCTRFKGKNHINFNNNDICTNSCIGSYFTKIVE